MPVHKPEEVASEADTLQSASKRRKNEQNGDSEKESGQESLKSSKNNGTVAPTPSKASKDAQNGTAGEVAKDQKSAKKAPKDGKEKKAGEADDHSKCNGATTPAAKANKDHSAKKKDKEKKSDHKAKKNGLNGVVKSSQGQSGKKNRNHDNNTSSADEAAPSEPREEVKVHMARFLQYQPSGISAIAHDDIGERLAVARDNGDIQIWSTSLPRWHPVAACAGSQESKIRSLCWSRYKAEDCPGGARLFSASLSGHVTEWSLGSLMPIHVTETYGGPAWCMAASPDQSMLAVGCHDGMCRLFSVTEDSGPMFAKSLPPHPGQVSLLRMCVCMCVQFFIV
jgi:hypothetical protein